MALANLGGATILRISMECSADYFTDSENTTQYTNDTIKEEIVSNNNTISDENDQPKNYFIISGNRPLDITFKCIFLMLRANSEQLFFVCMGLMITFGLTMTEVKNSYRKRLQSIISIKDVC